eukprot:COSAG01_NODE_73006_length_251_cov_0.993421_1_plen_36_part_01
MSACQLSAGSQLTPAGRRGLVAGGLTDSVVVPCPKT